MKRFLIILALASNCLTLHAADSTIANLTPLTTIPDTFRMPWENPGTLAYYITFNNLTNQILFGMANTAYVNNATNDLNTALVNKLNAATNDLNTGLSTKIGNATNDLNTALTGPGSSTAFVTSALLTNKVHWTNVVSLTNSQFQTVNMSIKEGDFQTNAAFAFLGLTAKSTTNYQSSVITVYNTTASAVAITAPANVHTNGVLPYNVTNISKVLIEYHPLYNYTNMLVFPVY